MRPSIETFVRENPFGNFHPLYRLLGETVWKKGWGENCIDLCKGFAQLLTDVHSMTWLRAETGIHCDLATQDSDGTWYWSPSLAQAEPFRLEEVWTKQFAQCRAFPIVEGRWSELFFSCLEGRGFSVSKRVPRLGKSGFIEKVAFRFEETDFGKEPPSDEELLREDRHYMWSTVMADGATVSLHVPTSGPCFVRQTGPNFAEDFEDPLEMLLALDGMPSSLGLKPRDLLEKMRDLPDLARLYHFTSGI